jgi:DNA-binding NtrC family response regulator
MLELLLIDDDATILRTMSRALRRAGHRLTIATDGAQGLAFATSKVFDVIITDVRLPRVDGLTIFRRARAESPSTDVILITGFGDVADAVTALKEGAFDYLTKPFDVEELWARLAFSEEKRKLRQDAIAAREALQRIDDTERIIGRSPVVLRLLERIDAIAASNAPVLITGESGTGKELVAHELHARSARHDGPFVAVNCAALPESLLEAELFGHERGAFTGAVNKRDGRFKAASGGTLFLDEIAEIPPAAQSKLLRVLDGGTIEPLGTNKAVRVDVRIVSATHQSLKQRIADGRFREDLYYRLNVLDLHVPPLRERQSDLQLLVQHFVLMHARLTGGVEQNISPRAWSALVRYTFPGNVRELQHAIERACVLASGGEIGVEHLPDEIAATDALSGVHSRSTTEPKRTLSMAMKEFECQYLVHTLSLTHGKRAEAAKLLGITRKNLWEKLRAYGVTNDPGA